MTGQTPGPGSGQPPGQTPGQPPEQTIEQALIEAIERDPRNDAAFEVYADWLQAQGLLRGELAALQLGAEEHPGDHRIIEAAAAFLREHAVSFLGEAARLCDSKRLGWRCGFLRSIEWSAEPGWERKLAALLSLESARFLAELRIESHGDGDELASTAEVLAAHAPATLRSLWLETGSGWLAPVGDLSALWPRVPELDELVLHGRPTSLGELELPRLRRATLWLDAESGAIRRRLGREVAAARWPCIEALHLWGGSAVEAIDATLARSDLETLGELGIVNCAFADEVCESIVRSPLAPQLYRLSLARGTLTDRGVETLHAHREELPSLALVDVSHTFVTANGLARLRELATDVVAHELRTGTPRVQLGPWTDHDDGFA